MVDPRVLGSSDDKKSMLGLERAFLALAVERKLLTAAVRDEIAGACERARGESETLRPWRAAVVRGHLARVQAERLLAEVTARAEAEHALDSSDVATASQSASQLAGEDDGDDPASETRKQKVVSRDSAAKTALDERLGALAVDTGIVTATQLKLAQKAQRGRKRAGEAAPLGEVLVAEGLAPRAILDILLVLEESVHERGHEDVSSMALHADLRFAKVALDLSLVSPDDLERAVLAQKKRGPASVRSLTDGLAFVLVEQGAMTAEARSLVLGLQDRAGSGPLPLPGPPPTGDDGEVSRFLTDNHLVTATTIQLAVELQTELRGKGIDRGLGDLLVLQGAIDRPTLETIAKTQEKKKPPPAKRRRAAEEPPPPPPREHPLTLAAGVGIGLLLVSLYVLATGGLSSLPRVDSPPPRERGRAG